MSFKEPIVIRGRGEGPDSRSSILEGEMSVYFETWDVGFGIAQVQLSENVSRYGECSGDGKHRTMKRRTRFNDGDETNCAG